MSFVVGGVSEEGWDGSVVEDVVSVDCEEESVSVVLNSSIKL